MFQLTAEEASAVDSVRSQSVTLKQGRGAHRKYRPFAFTEQGVAMLSNVLRSPRAVEVNIAIMRTFVSTAVAHGFQPPAGGAVPSLDGPTHNRRI